MRICVSVLITIFICILLSIAAIREMWFHEQRFKLQILQEQIALADLRCQKALRGSAITECENISSEALFELGQLPDRDIIKQLDARQLELVKAYERGDIKEEEKNKALAQLQIETTSRLNAAESHTPLSPFDFLFTY